MANQVASARVDEDVHKALDRYAKATTRNKSQVVEMAIRAFLATPEVVAILKAK